MNFCQELFESHFSRPEAETQRRHSFDSPPEVAKKPLKPVAKRAARHHRRPELGELSLMSGGCSSDIL